MVISLLAVNDHISPFGITDRTYTYDYQYRLVQSYGKSDREYNYELEMMYSPAGRLYRSFSRNDISDFTEIIYGYDRDKITHQPRVLFIPTHSEQTLQLYWDANGNLCQQKSCYEGFGRLHYWDEENRLQMVIDRRYCSYYGYNATDERLYKITGVNSNDQLNGGYGSAKIDFDEATLYPFQYLTIKPQYYTKHYFIGNEHIATTFGNGGFEKVTQNTERKPETVHESQLMYWFYNMQWGDPYVFRTNTIGETTQNIDYKGLEQSDLQYKCDPTIVADLYASWRPRLHNVIGNNLGILNRKQESYFYHNDHLGSTKLVMDGRGRICNEIDYMPFGETFHPITPRFEEHKFTGKERDEETNYDYFGARYYWSAAKHWLSVDPLSDKYPGISPYAYCGWNPINYIDPDGKKIVIGIWYGRLFANLGFDNFESKVMSQLQKLKCMDPELNAMITGLENSPMTFHITYDSNKRNYYNRNTKTIGYDPENDTRRNGEVRPPEAALVHELGHAENDMNNATINTNVDTGGKNGANELDQKNLNEINSIYYENIVREYEGYPQRGYNYVNGD